MKKRFVATVLVLTGLTMLVIAAVAPQRYSATIDIYTAAGQHLSLRTNSLVYYQKENSLAPWGLWYVENGEKVAVYVGDHDTVIVRKQVGAQTGEK